MRNPLSTQSAIFFSQGFDVDFITNVVRRGAELWQLWGEPVWGEEATGILGRYDQRVSNRCASNSAFEDLGDLLLRASAVANFNALPVLLAAFQEDLEESNLLTQCCLHIVRR